MMSSRMANSMRIAIPVIALVVSVTIVCGWAFIYFGIYLGYGNYKVRGHQEFARNGVSQIPPAQQMDELFEDCRHYISYGDVPLFTSVAYFGQRYKLTMQVPVSIQSGSSGTMTGVPIFYLNEISKISISPSGQIEASFSRSHNFGNAEWMQVYNAQGDFSTIGFEINNKPVVNFQKYADAARPSN